MEINQNLTTLDQQQLLQENIDQTTLQSEVITQIQPVEQQQQEQVLINDDQNQMSDDDSEDDKPGNNTSDTSSYMSDNESRMYEVEETKEKAVPAEDKQMDMIDEFEENTVSSYAKFKTQNEIDLEQIDKYAPKIPELDELDDILEFGIVKKFIEDGQSNVILIQPLNPNQIYDLDNIVCFKNKQVVGFVLDLVGHINQPLYTVRVYPQFIEKLHSQNIEPKNQLIDAKIYLVAKSLKVINAQLPVILSKKGCDASNIYDEELAEHEREFSDDEKEREAKKARKNKKKLKQQQQQNSNRVMEEGEIEEEEDQILQKRKFNQSHHQNHHDNKHKGGQHQNNDFKHKKRFNEDFRQNQGQQIPMYSTNFAVNQQQNVPQMQQPAANPMQNNMMMYQQQFNNMYGQQQQYPQNAFGMAQAFQQQAYFGQQQQTPYMQQNAFFNQQMQQQPQQQFGYGVPQQMNYPFQQNQMPSFNPNLNQFQQQQPPQ